MGTAHTRRIRARVTAGLAGTVVEVGFGTGHNLTLLPVRVSRLLAVEPSRSSIDRAGTRIAGAGIPVEIISADGQRLPLSDASVDAALCTSSRCTIPDPVAAVRELARVLRPGGRLHFVEHGLAPDEDVRRWQSRSNRLQRRFVGDCTLDRDIPALLPAGGMTVTRPNRYSGQGQPKALAAMYEGAAIPA